VGARFGDESSRERIILTNVYLNRKNVLQQSAIQMESIFCGGISRRCHATVDQDTLRDAGFGTNDMQSAEYGGTKRSAGCCSK
jgi:hypothetical protein